MHFMINTNVNNNIKQKLCSPDILLANNMVLIAFPFVCCYVKTLVLTEYDDLNNIFDS